MVDKRISELDPAGPLTGDELVELVQQVDSKLDNVRSPLRDIVEQLALQGPQGSGPQAIPACKVSRDRKENRDHKASKDQKARKESRDLRGSRGPAGPPGTQGPAGAERCAWYRWR